MSTWRSAAVGLVCGLIFAAGLALSGMTDPGRVLGFLDFTGDWDPRLAWVMVGAISVHFSWLRLAPRLQGPGAQAFSLAPHAPITRPLIVGAVLFGIGWGMAGYCPGPALVSLGLGAREGSVFLAAMLGGMGLFQALSTRRHAAVEPSEGATAVPDSL
jgi:uncharacterized membrane protein YedE/YeeE